MSAGHKKALEPWAAVAALAQVARAVLELVRYLTGH
jgi:hypothetical protein